MTNEENYMPTVHEVGNETIPNTETEEIKEVPSSAVIEDTSSEQWDYYNMVNSVEPDHRKRTGTNQTPAKKQERKKKKARRIQRASRKINRK